MKINTKKEGFRSKSHKNFMDAPCYSLTPFVRLYVMTVSSFFGEPAFYENGSNQDQTKSPSLTHSKYLNKVLGSFDSAFSKLSSLPREEAVALAIKDSLLYDAELTMAYLVWLRNSANIRTTSQVGLAIASNLPELKGSSLVGKFGVDIMARLDDTSSCLAYYINKFGKPVPNSLKRVLRSRIMQATEYELAKYKKENYDVSLKDIVKITHAKSEAINKLMKDELKQSNEGTETWEAIISTKGSTTKNWIESIGVMGHMALLRNLNNFEKFNVPTKLYLDKLINGVRDGKQLPFRYYLAYKKVTSWEIKEALEKCINISVSNLSKLKGRTLVLVDNSGSAQLALVSKLGSANVSTVGNLMGILTCLISDKGKLGVFGDHLKTIPIHKNTSVLEMLETVNDLGETVGESTENGIWLALDNIIKSKEHFDRIFIYSDMQAGHGGLYGLDDSEYPAFGEFGENKPSDDIATTKYIDVPYLLEQYRKEVNSDCNTYCVQIGGYADNLFPEFYPKTFILSGWSPEILRFASYMEETGKDIESIFKEKFKFLHGENKK